MNTSIRVLLPLTNGGHTYVSAEDAPRLSMKKWYATKRGRITYAASTSPRDRKLLHRAVMKAEKGQQLDHIDSDGLNNVRHNLRFCSQAQNTRNASKYLKPTTSRYKGVYLDNKGRWRATIAGKGPIGQFETEGAAALAYNEAATKRFGEFAKLNIVEDAESHEAYARWKERKRLL